MNRTNQSEPIVAVALLSERELHVVGHQLQTLYAVHDTPEFDALIDAIDRADSQADQDCRAR